LLAINSADVGNNHSASKMPVLADLVKSLELAQEEPSRPVSLFWFEAVSNNELKLSVVINPDEKEPLWQCEKTSEWFEKKLVFAKRSFDAEMILAALSPKNQLDAILEERVDISVGRCNVVSSVDAGIVRPDFKSEGDAKNMGTISGSYAPLSGGFITGFSEESFQEEKGESNRPVRSPATISANNLLRRIGIEVKLEELMSASGLLTRAQVAEALSRSERTGLHVGRVLADYGVVAEKLMRAALRMQSLLRDGALDLETAARALALINEAGIEPEAALRILGWNRGYFDKYQQLAAIIFEAQLASFEELQASLEVCFSRGLPLALVLLQRRICSEVAMYASVAAQSLLIEGNLSRFEALRLIKSVATVDQSLGNWLKTEHLFVTVNERLMFSEMLVKAEILSGPDLLDVLERSLLEEKLLEEILVSRRMLTAELCDALIAAMHHAETPQLAAEMASIVYVKAGHTLNGATRGDSTKLAADMIRAAGLSSADDLAGIVEELVLRKQHLAYKVVHQYEQVKAAVARDLHDVILADLLSIKRNLNNQIDLSKEDTAAALDQVVFSLREIVNDYAPRQLHDWGLNVFLEDLVERFRKRTGITCHYQGDDDLEALPEQVELQIFRVIQEALTNIEKYAEATLAKLSLTIRGKDLVIVVEDDGRGIEPKPAQPDELFSGGAGLSGMEERVQLIRCYMPAKLTISSNPGEGVKIVLAIEVG
jgi:signal transduction histidine kinase